MFAIKWNFMFQAVPLVPLPIQLSAGPEVSKQSKKGSSSGDGELKDNRYRTQAVPDEGKLIELSPVIYH